jgi:DNA recombination-mediator protein A
MTKIGIVGSRNISSQTAELVREYIRNLTDADLEIISGSARGVDSVAANEATLLNIKVTEFVPEYFEYGRIAPLIRNDRIVDASDKIVAFWDGQSKGTKYTIKRARHRGKPVEVIEIPVFQGDESVLQTDDPGSNPGAGTTLEEKP